jgi:hypothetical protein
MKSPIMLIFITLAFVSSCVNKQNTTEADNKADTQADIIDPNELKTTEVENLDSIEVKGLSNYKAVEMLTEDLDGDKVKEQIIVRVSPSFFQNETDDPMGIVETPAIISIGNQFIRTKLHVNSFYENGRSYTIAIKDINTKDNLKEITFIPSIHGVDPPGDYQVIRYIDGKMSHFRIPGDGLQNDRLIINENGTFSVDYTIDINKEDDPVAGNYNAKDIKKVFFLSNKGIAFKVRDTGQAYTKEFTD